MTLDGSREPVSLRYVALGDSYTIGTGVEAVDRWPDRLVAALGAEPPTLELIANLALDGRTSADVLEQQLPALWALDPGFASLLIGVNDVVRGWPLAGYRGRCAAILDALGARLGPDRVLVVTVPDYTVTPSGTDYGDPIERAAAIRAANATMTDLASARGIAIVDIHDLSLAAATDRSLVAPDGLHPSALQYARWVKRMVPVVAERIGRP